MNGHHLPSPVLLFSEAHVSGQQVVDACARSVLRQVALKSLRQTVDWSVASTTEQPHSMQFELTMFHYESAQESCRIVTDAWCRKLELKGLKQTADQIKELFEREVCDLFHDVPPTDNYLRTKTTDADAAESSRGSNAITSLGQILSVVRTSDALEPTADSVTKSMESSRLLAMASNKLDDLAGNNKTDWPYSWKVIQDKIREIPGRLYNTKREASVIEIVPRSVWEQQEDQQKTADQLADDARRFILKRRRRNMSTLPPSQTVKRQRKDRANEDIPRAASTQPASINLPPLDDDSVQFSLLRQFIHSDADISNPHDPSATLLGPLTLLGRTHLAHQVVVDTPDISNWNPKRLRLAQHKAKAERLGTHFDAKDTNESKSKIRRTQESSDEAHWIDMDVGPSILEIGPVHDRRLLWFNSIEASLLDEDVDDDEEDEEENDEDCDEDISTEGLQVL